ncbi:HAD family hydrolase [Streptomyces sp. TP-A0874]|uniref:HAD family hydrolase n=1 Tax=Streptomyces sp. TP-A0874 TaxID=549819 RepID=UPI000853C808|nr:HAD family hydrolase [Streptomyces sp. TP-A0874]
MRYDLVIFDNDGVLVDSEPISNRVLAEYLTELGHPTSYEESVRDFMGGAVHRIHDLVWERTGRRLPGEFDDVFHSRVFEAFQRELHAVKGVSEVLDTLKTESVPFCVASSGSHQRIRVALRKTGLYERFAEHTIFSSQDVNRGKPAPDLFLHAAAAMGVDPQRCVVIEDSPLGVQAARAAGMRTLGFTGMTEPSALASAHSLFAEMTELPSLLYR